MTTAIVIDDSTFSHVYLAENRVVQRRSDAACIGSLDDTAAKALSKLVQEETVHIELMANATSDQCLRRNKKQIVAFASAIIYGPEDLADDVGDFLDKCNYYLQDPFGCKHNVPYTNPHCLANLFEDSVMTFDLQQPKENGAKFSLSASLKALETGDGLPEFDQPAALKTELCRYVDCGLWMVYSSPFFGSGSKLLTITSHQKQALWFFLNRETSHHESHVWQPKILANGSTV